jgi:acetone carboxylase, gamma subunit
MEKVSKQLVRQLVDGSITRDDAQALLKMNPKDPERFWTYLEVLQERVPWTDPILLRISDHLYVVRKHDGRRLVKCDCGQELGDYRANWKTECQVRVRTSEAQFHEVYYPPALSPEPGFNEIREFFCPGCFAQLAVEVVPPGYPLIFEVLPDLDRLYREFLGRPLTDENPAWYRDTTAEKVAGWLAAW